MAHMKGSSLDEFIEVMMSLIIGGFPMSSEIACKVVHYFHKTGGPKDELERLSKRVEEMLRLLGKGLRHKEIAEK